MDTENLSLPENTELVLPEKRAHSAENSLSSFARTEISHLGYCRLFRKTNSGDFEFGKISIMDIFNENFTIIDPQSFQSWHYDSLEELLNDGWLENQHLLYRNLE